MYRDALGLYHTPCSVNEMFSDDEVIYNNSLIYPNTLIRMSRLLLFVRIVRKNPPVVLNLLLQATFGEGSWAARLQHDLKWLAVSEKFRLCSDFSLVQWVVFFALMLRVPTPLGSIACPLGLTIRHIILPYVWFG